MRIFMAFTAVVCVLVAAAVFQDGGQLGAAVPDDEAAALVGGENCAPFNTHTCNGDTKGCVATTCYLYKAGCTITNKYSLGTSPCGNAANDMCGIVVDALGNCKGSGN